MIIRARVVVTMDGPPIEDGAVAISGDRIIDVGKFAEVEGRNPGEVLDLGDQALLPGLINAHCHLEYTCLRGKIPRQDSFTDWVRTINAEKAKLSAEDYLASIREGFAEVKRYGTTTIANLEAFPELIAKIEEPIRTWWFAELIDVREPRRAKEIVDVAVDSVKAAKNWGLAPHAPFTASAALYRYAYDVGGRENVLLTTHLAESHEELSMFCDASGPLFDFMREIGRDMNDCGRTTPLSLFSKILGAPGGRALPRNDKEWLVAHLNEVTEGDFDLLEIWTDRLHVVHCPRSHQYFGHSPFQFEKLSSLGFNICLGTDSLASNYDLSLFGEMRAFQRNWPRVSPEEILSMVTVNPAQALGKPYVIGRIRQNYFADLLAIPFGGSRKNLFDALVAHEDSVLWIMIGGETADL
jgi:cytosine/adenosine deaminase-related metal-dependent hydrolase